MTVANGRFTLRALLRGEPLDGLWSGTDEAGHEVWVTLRRWRASAKPEQILRFSSYGIEAPLYLGAPDVEAGWRDYRFCVVEAAPRGHTLRCAGRFSEGEGARLGVSLCDVVANWAAASDGMIFSGLHIETVYVAGRRRFMRAVPRPHFLLGLQSHFYGYRNISFDPPGYRGSLMTPRDAVFTIALLVWWAMTGVQPYYIAGTDPEANALDDRRIAFDGSPALGDILARALVGDPDKRIGVDELRADLATFAQGFDKPDRRHQIENSLGRPLTEDELVVVEDLAALPPSHLDVLERLFVRSAMAPLLYVREVTDGIDDSKLRRYANTFDDIIAQRSNRPKLHLQPVYEQELGRALTVDETSRAGSLDSLSSAQYEVVRALAAKDRETAMTYLAEIVLGVTGKDRWVFLDSLRLDNERAE